VTGTVGKKVFPRWISVAAHKTQGNELTVASASSSNKKSTVGFFAFATKAEAHSFIEEPPNCAIIPIGGGSAIWEDSLQAGFEGNESNKLNSESVVYDVLAGDAAAIFLQQGDVVVVGEYHAPPDNSNGGYDLIAVGVSGETEAAGAPPESDGYGSAGSQRLQSAEPPRSPTLCR
jgi:hypothetical protein